MSFYHICGNIIYLWLQKNRQCIFFSRCLNLICCFTLYFWKLLKSHWSHLKLMFSWINFTCFNTLLCSSERKLHWLHLYFLNPWRCLICCLRFIFSRKDDSHPMHWKTIFLQVDLLNSLRLDNKIYLSRIFNYVRYFQKE